MTFDLPFLIGYTFCVFVAGYLVGNAPKDTQSDDQPQYDEDEDADL